jgi:short-subunit dehydrogenase
MTTRAEDFRARYGPWALVAGASDGLGAEFAAQLAARGLSLVLVARRAEMLETLAARLRSAHAVQVRALRLDLGRSESVAEIAAHLRQVEVGLLVYNAALSAIGPFWEHTLEEHLRELEVNCRTPLSLAYLAGRQMVARRAGGIILMSSMSAAHGSALIANYAATKAYNQMLAEGLWEELRGQGVDVLCCRAGATRTPNYVASLAGRPDGAPVSAMTPEAVVAETLAALGKGPGVIPGRLNRLAAFVMSRLLPRRAAIQIMGRVLRGMYAR